MDYKDQIGYAMCNNRLKARHGCLFSCGGREYTVDDRTPFQETLDAVVTAVEMIVLRAKMFGSRAGDVRHKADQDVYLKASLGGPFTRSEPINKPSVEVTAERSNAQGSGDGFDAKLCITHFPFRVRTKVEAILSAAAAELSALAKLCEARHTAVMCHRAGGGHGTDPRDY